MPFEYLRYKEIQTYLLNQITSGRYKMGSRLPSVLALSRQFGYATKTIHKAYRALSDRGIIEAVPRKGFFVVNNQPAKELNVFLLLDNYSTYKQSLFQTIKQSFGPDVDFSVRFHFYDPALFRRHIAKNVNRYSAYIVSPFYIEDLENVLSPIPPDKLYLLGRHPESLTQHYHGVFQDFKQDIIKGLTATGDNMWKYERLVLFFRDSATLPPDELQQGFIAFCRNMRMDYRIVKSGDPVKVQRGEGYVVIDDKDLIQIVQQANQKGFSLGQDIGLISYNDTPMKSIISQSGISVISTDFIQMGKTVVYMVEHNKFDLVYNPSYYIDRRSF